MSDVIRKKDWVESSIKSCDYLITNNSEGTSSKLLKAIEYGIAIINENQVKELLKGK